VRGVRSVPGDLDRLDGIDTRQHEVDFTRQCSIATHVCHLFFCDHTDDDIFWILHEMKIRPSFCLS